MMKKINLSKDKTLNLKGLFNVSDITGQRFRQTNKKYHQIRTHGIYPKGYTRCPCLNVLYLVVNQFESPLLFV